MLLYVVINPVNNNNNNTLHTTLNGGKGGVAMLVIDMGVKFRTVSVKCANIFDQDCRISHMSLSLSQVNKARPK
jgi:hypothetical protein